MRRGSTVNDGMGKYEEVVVYFEQSYEDCIFGWIEALKPWTLAICEDEMYMVKEMCEVIFKRM